MVSSLCFLLPHIPRFGTEDANNLETSISTDFFFRKPLLLGHHHPDTKTKQRCHKKRKSQANITDEHSCKSPQQKVLANRIQ